LEGHVTVDLEPGRPAIEAVFVALLVTTAAGTVLAHLLARVLPPAAAGGPPAAAALTVTVACVSLAFGFAQTVLPGSRSAGCAGLAIPMIGAITLAIGGHEPAIVVSALFAGIFLTPAAYYIAIRFSVALRAYARRRPFVAMPAGVVGALLLVQLLRVITHLADPAIDWRLVR
jgi:hypothetical protein